MECKTRKKLGENLKILRLNKSKSLKELSYEIGLSYSYLRELEDWRYKKNPSLEILELLSEYYRVEVYELFY